MFSYAPHYQIVLLVYKRRHLDCVVSFLSEQAANVAPRQHLIDLRALKKKKSGLR